MMQASPGSQFHLVTVPRREIRQNLAKKRILHRPKKITQQTLAYLYDFPQYEDLEMAFNNQVLDAVSLQPPEEPTCPSEYQEGDLWQDFHEPDVMDEDQPREPSPSLDPRDSSPTPLAHESTPIPRKSPILKPPVKLLTIQTREMTPSTPLLSKSSPKPLTEASSPLLDDTPKKQSKHVQEMVEKKQIDLFERSSEPQDVEKIQKMTAGSNKKMQIGQPYKATSHENHANQGKVVVSPTNVPVLVIEPQKRRSRHVKPSNLVTPKTSIDNLFVVQGKTLEDTKQRMEAIKCYNMSHQKANYWIHTTPEEYFRIDPRTL